MDKYRDHLHIHHILSNRYTGFLLSNTIRAVAVAIISLFIPVFLLIKGVSITEVIIFEIAVFLIDMIVHFPVFAIIRRIGAKTTLISSYFIGVIFYFILHQFDALTHVMPMSVYLGIIALLNAIYSSTYWMSYHTYFVMSTSKKERGKRLGMVAALPVVLSIASPIIGGLLIDSQGFGITFILSIALLLIAVIPLLFAKNAQLDIRWSVRKSIKGRSRQRNTVFFLEGTTFIGTGFLWPILLYLFSISISVMGGLYFISKIAYAACTYISGKKSDKGEIHKLMRIGSMGIGTSLIARSLSKIFFLVSGLNPVFFAGFFQTMGGLSAPLYIMPIQSLFYKKSDEEGIVNTILNREIYLTIGRTLFLIIIIVLVFLFPVEKAFIIALILTGISSFGFWHTSKNINEELLKESHQSS